MTSSRGPFPPRQRAWEVPKAKSYRHEPGWPGAGPQLGLWLVSARVVPEGVESVGRGGSARVLWEGFHGPLQWSSIGELPVSATERLETPGCKSCLSGQAWGGLGGSRGFWQ